MAAVPLALVSTTWILGCVAGAGSPPGRAAYRRVQRAYDGAPPVIPHAVRALQREDCLTCHGEGMEVEGGGLAPRTPHPGQVSCPQCHVEQVTRREGLARNAFVGLRYPARGTRAYRGAPPTIPHPLQGRRNCPGCHGESGGSPIRTPHQDRVNCPQCHVPSTPGTAAWRGNSFRGIE
jgi:cytochrome c-type protein NapB